MDRYVVKCTYAPAGTGKTWRRASKFLVDEWLPYGGDGVHYSNFPLRLQPWKDEKGRRHPGLIAYAAKRHKLPVDEVERRVRTIPPDVLRSWQDGESGPWEYFADADLSGAHIAIDEAHTFWPSARVPGGPERVDKLMHWLSTVRHTGATVEFITQHPNQIHDKIRDAAGGEFVLTNLQDFSIPWVKVRFGDLFDLVEVFFGFYPTWVRQDEFKRNGSRREKIESDTSYMNPFYFQFYDSHSKPATGGKAGKSAERTVPRLGRLKTLRYFLHRYWFRLLLLTIFLAALQWVCSNGRIAKGYLAFTNKIMAVASGKKSPSSDGADPVPVAPGMHSVVKGKIAAIETDPRLVEFSPAARKMLRGIMTENFNLKQQVSSVELQLEQARADAAQLEAAAKDRASVCLITPDGVCFSGGEFARVGDTLRFGPYAGAKVEAVNYASRAVLISGDRWLRLASLVPVPDGLRGEQAQGGVSGDDLPRPLRAAEADGPGRGAGSRPVGPVGDALGGRDASSAVRPLGQ